MKCFRDFPLFVIFLMACLIFVSFSSDASQDSVPGRKPYKDYNVVLIFIDTLRADHLSCYGYERKTSPNIDELAEESAVFEQNFTPMTYTLASFASIMTSLYPRSHGVFDVFKDKYPLKIKTLPEILKLYGYQTVWFGEPYAPHLEPGRARGYDRTYRYDRDFVSEGRKLAAKWLADNKEKKFFLLFHTYKAHAPYGADSTYKKVFMGQEHEYKEIIETSKDLRKAVFEFIKAESKNKEGKAWVPFREDAESSASFLKLFEGNFSRKKWRAIKKFLDERNQRYKLDDLGTYVYWLKVSLDDPDIREYVKALYDAAILQIDTDLIGPFIKKLKELRLYDKTIIIIFGDHGEEFYEHGGQGHGGTLYDEATHVPLIIRIPWAKGGKRIKELTQTVDIMPTILDFLEIPVPHEAQGKSLAGFIDTDGTGAIQEYVFGQCTGASSIRSKEWKFILNDDGRRELYRLKSDPGEQVNLFEREKAKALELEAKLRTWEASLPSYKDKDYSFPSEIDKETQEKIRKTGYW